MDGANGNPNPSASDAAGLLKDWMVGLEVKIFTANGEVVQGSLLTFDPEMNCAAVIVETKDNRGTAGESAAANSPPHAASKEKIGAHAVVLVRTTTLSKVEVVKSKPDDKSAALGALRRPLPPLAWEQIREREKYSSVIIRDHQRRHDIGVPDRGVEVFRALSKTLPCRWGPADSIVILDTLRLTPPYTPGDLRAIENDASALSRVKLVLEKERAKIFA